MLMEFFKDWFNIPINEHDTERKNVVMKFPENRKLRDIINTEEDQNIMWDNLDDSMVAEKQIEWHLILQTAKS